jgi:GNAT superfamily N-acetyltransferase
MALKIQIRPVLPGDAAAFSRLNGLFNGSSEPPEAYLPRLADPRRVDTPLLAWVVGRAVGIANLRVVPTVFYPEPYAELTELYVEDAYRRQGVGRALIGYAEDLARQSGAVELVILTDAENHPAQQLYRGLGYVDHDQALSKAL